MELFGILLAATSLALFGLNARRLVRGQQARALLAPIDGDADIALTVAHHAATSRGHALAPLHVLYGLVQDATFTGALVRAGGDPAALEDALLDELERFDGTGAGASSPEPFHADNAASAIVTARVYARHHDRTTMVADVWQAISRSAVARLVAIPPARLTFALIHGDDAPRAELPRETAVHVVLRNDDYTTFEFVMVVLREIFELSDEAARAVTLATHAEGRAIVGQFPASAAKTKVEAAWARAETERFPLWVGVEIC